VWEPPGRYHHPFIDSYGARSPSGKAKVCKTFIGGSIPPRASNFPQLMETVIGSGVRSVSLSKIGCCLRFVDSASKLFLLLTLKGLTLGC
jgi:hypothetical protein